MYMYIRHDIIPILFLIWFPIFFPLRKSVRLLLISLKKSINPFASEAAIIFSTSDRCFPCFESFAGSRVNTPLMAVTNMGWRVYMYMYM